jgi:imidazolonepropionase-like amidohydrolase
MQALQAATGWAAECLGLEDEVGTVTPGKRADLVAVEGNPLQNITVLHICSIAGAQRWGSLCRPAGRVTRALPS